MHFVGHYDSPLGGILLASDGKSLTGLWFDGQKYFADTLDREREEQELPVFGNARYWLDLYFQGVCPEFTPPLKLEGSPFRLAVWEILQKIPYGQVMTYGEIARLLALKTGKPSMSAQAVGGAVGHNPISVIIPCHRVVGSNGSLTGYAGGIEKKVQLLTLEKVDMKSFFVPKKGTALSPVSRSSTI